MSLRVTIATEAGSLVSVKVMAVRSRVKSRTYSLKVSARSPVFRSRSNDSSEGGLLSGV